MLLLEMEAWADLQLVSWIQWQLLTIQLGDMVSDMTMVYSSKSLKMEVRFRFLISGSQTAILGKYKESMLNTRFIFMEKSGGLQITRESRDATGKIVRQSLLGLMIHLFQDMQLSILLPSDFGNLYLSTSLIFTPLTKVRIKVLLRQDREQNTLQVYYILMIQLKLVKSLD
jgi:hypothetical protein